MENEVLELDPTFAELQSRQAGTQGQVAGGVAAPASTVTSIDGLKGDLSFNVGAPVNGVQIVITPAGAVIIFSISGIGTMAQRNAIAAVADISTPDASDLTTAVTLVNAVKAKMNEFLGKARTAVHVAP